MTLVLYAEGYSAAEAVDFARPAMNFAPACSLTTAPVIWTRQQAVLEHGCIGRKSGRSSFA